MNKQEAHQAMKDKISVKIAESQCKGIITCLSDDESGAYIKPHVGIFPDYPPSFRLFYPLDIISKESQS